jgi:hypothetical protein
MQPVSRKSFGKHVPTRNNILVNCVSVDDFYSSLLGSSQFTNELRVAIT